MRVELQLQRKARIEMLPLIDIVFLLLVFFIYAMLSMAVHRALPVELPSSERAQLDKHSVLSVTVKADGTIYVDKEAVALETLSAVLQGKAQKGGDAGVLLFGDKGLSYQALFRVLDQVRKAGLHRISLQAEMDP